MSKTIKIALVDDHQLFRKGMAQLVGGFPNTKIVIEAENGQDLLNQLATKKTDIVFMDLYMPEMNGIQATIQIQQNYPEVKIIALSMHNEKKFILEMIKNGANGFLSKNSEPQELQEAISSVMTTGYYFNNYVTEALYMGWQNKRKVDIDLKHRDSLTNREREVMVLISTQFTTSEIAKELFLSPRTIENHRHRILEKIGVRNIAGMVIYAIENGYVEVDLTKGG